MRNKLIDVWRMPNPQKKASLFQTTSKAMAHIDRIYVTQISSNMFTNEVGMGQEIK